MIGLDGGGKGTERGSRAGRGSLDLRGDDGKTGPLDSGWLVPFLLLGMREGDLLGYELLWKASDLGFGSVQPGEVYRVLREAEGEGLVFSERGEVGYMLSQRRYGLTESGQAYLEFFWNSLHSYRREMEVFFRAYEGRPSRGPQG